MDSEPGSDLRGQLEERRWERERALAGVQRGMGEQNPVREELAELRLGPPIDDELDQ